MADNPFIPKGQLRVVPSFNQRGMPLRDVLLVGVLLAAGAVLKYFVGAIINFGMKPNFIIAMYCLAVLLLRPGVLRAAAIGLLAGAVCQLFPGTPFLNLVSELVGAVVMCLLARLPLDIGKLSLRPVVCTFFATLASGFNYIGLMYVAFYSGASVTPTPLGVFMGIVFGTAAINAVIVQVLYVPLKLAVAGGKTE